MRQLARGTVLRAANDAGRCIFVDEGVVEKPKPELHQQQSSSRSVDPGFRDETFIDQAAEDFDAFFAAELVRSCFKDFQHAAPGVEVFYSPGPGRVGPGRQ
ncbi:hypothetical protein StoSoilB13_27080 (plasmid) [Arthrobacter sp. StoSoilB13]|nr:hypothetical protein StoSoilB13_27080 [Arthrobacter sp. StoSoilB13]